MPLPLPLGILHRGMKMEVMHALFGAGRRGRRGHLEARWQVETGVFTLATQTYYKGVLTLPRLKPLACFNLW